MMTNSSELVLYFSATGKTEEVAKKIAKVRGINIQKITPTREYSKDDLNYNNDKSRANKEQNDPSSRPEIEKISDITNYDIIYLGYPIWWGKSPKVIYTLLDSYDFKDKTIIPFCTSGSSDIYESVNSLKATYKNINWLDGKRFSSSALESEIQTWIDSIKINNIQNGKKLYIEINNKVLTATLENNSSVDALINKLMQKDITIDMHDYGNFEKVGSL